MLITMRKIKNQESFIKNGDEESEFIVLPFNKVENVFKDKCLNKKSYLNSFKEEDKENKSNTSFMEKKIINKNANKILLNDIFDIGYSSHFISKNNFLTLSIIKTAFAQRYFYIYINISLFLFFLYYFLNFNKKSNSSKRKNIIIRERLQLEKRIIQYRKGTSAIRLDIFYCIC